MPFAAALAKTTATLKTTAGITILFSKAGMLSRLLV